VLTESVTFHIPSGTIVIISATAVLKRKSDADFNNTGLSPSKPDSTYCSSCYLKLDMCKTISVLLRLFFLTKETEILNVKVTSFFER